MKTYYPTNDTWNDGTIVVPGRRQRTWVGTRRLTTGWHTLTSAVGNLTGRHRRDLDAVIGQGNN